MDEIIQGKGLPLRMNAKEIVSNLQNIFLMEFINRIIFMGEDGGRYVPRHATRRIDESAPVNFGGFYRFASQFVKGKSVLDTGCGYGFGVDYLLRNGASFCVGIDRFKRAISFAKRNYKAPNLEYYIMDAADLSCFYDSSFDILLSIEVIAQIFDYKKYVSEISRVMKKNSILILSTPNREMALGRPGPIFSKHNCKELYFEELRDLLNNYFGEVIIFENLMTPPYEEGQKRRLERQRRGDIGYAWAPKVITKYLAINCRYLYANDTSFVAVCVKV